MSYSEFLRQKSQVDSDHGFDPISVPDFLFGFQRHLVEWSIRKGRGAIFADCGLGKSPMQLVWADNVVRHTGKPVLILTPLAVGHQTAREGHKFGIECRRSPDGKVHSGINIANYERLHYFEPADFSGVVCDESSAIKSFNGKRRAEVTEFLRTIPYRLLCTATAAPNDYAELGTSSEALGELGYMDMLGRFFVNNQNTCDTKGRYRGFAAPRAFETKKWRFKGHAEMAFWRWVSSWARACRKPSDLGFEDEGFDLPEKIEVEHVVAARRLAPGLLFPVPAVGLQEQREERRRTIQERCEKAAELVEGTGRPAVVWCHLNDEGDLLERLIPDAVQVKGPHTIEQKEERYQDFSEGRTRVLVIKPKIGAWGLNWQHCSHVVTFASHSYEQHYQSVRRCWRFGQENPVTVDIIATEGEANVRSNLSRKQEAAEQMFAALVEHMHDAITIQRTVDFEKEMRAPLWM